MNPLRELYRHKLDYFILAAMLGIFVFSFFYVWPNVFYERALIVLLSVLYFAWGMYHHIKTDKVTTKIMLEYFFAASLSGAILFLLTVK